MTADPKLAAQRRFANADWNQRGMDLVTRCATDPPLVVRGLIDSIRERAGPGARVLELGFGGGWLLEALIDEHFDFDLYGLDLSPGMARSAHDRLGEHVRIVNGDMEALPFRAGAFDVIVTCWTLYFMREVDIALAEIRRCQTPNGRLIAAASAPDHEAECGDLVAQAIRAALGRDEPRHDVSTRFDLDSGASILTRHFRNVAVRRWDGEMVLSTAEDVVELWPKWEPALMSREEQQAIRVEFLRLTHQRLARDGELRIRRRNGAFVCDL